MPQAEFKEIEELEKLKEIMLDQGVIKLYVKFLSPNDNSKNQVYLGSDFEALNIIPNKGVYVDDGRQGSKRDRFKADVALFWVDSTGRLEQAPNSQLILYPKYPEVRMSGFLKGCSMAPSALIRSRKEGRLLFLGISNSGNIIGHMVGSENALRNEIEALSSLESAGVFLKISLNPACKTDTRSELITTLKAIHLEGWLDSVRLSSDGQLMSCNASNCGGYTLEAKLGIKPNGWSEPDFLGWEIKQHGVTSFDRPYSGGPITLMTPEPTAGIYKEKGVEYFIREFGYPDKKGRKDRINFGGIYRNGVPVSSTGLTLCINGFDSKSGKITNPDGGISLVSSKEEEAATWLFTNIMEHWNRKHAQAAYIPSLCQKSPLRKYQYGNLVGLGERTDFIKYLKAMASGKIYYDPGIKLEDASKAKPKIKRRSQFRIKTKDLNELYKFFTSEDLLK